MRSFVMFLALCMLPSLVFGQATQTAAAKPEQSEVQKVLEMISETSEGIKVFMAGTADSAMSAGVNRVEQISKTEVGRFTMVMIGWKIIGHKVLRYLWGIILLVFSCFFFTYAYKRDCMTLKLPKTKDPQGNVTSWYTHDKSNNAKWAYWGALMGIWIVAIIAMFAGRLA